MLQKRAKRRAQFISKNTIFACLATLLGLMIIEGFCSMVLTLHGFLIRPTRIAAERSHTEYDSLLGWVNRKNVYLPDFYEPGAYVQTNSQGFRNEGFLSQKVSVGKIRVICSGDSFTFGYGVANDKSLCHRLTVLHSSLESVNMGQGGYGGGQAYLWYRRDGIQLEHNVHLFLFNTVIFERMSWSNSRGYGKPILALRDNELVTDNIPVPKTGYYLPELTERVKYLRQTSMGRLMVKSISLFLSDKSPDPRPVTSEMLRQLQLLNQESGTVLVLVYLPAKIDHSADRSLVWRDFLDSESRNQNVPFIDLVPDFKGLDGNTVQEMFRSDGHYTVMGNQLVAEMLFRYLEGILQSADLLEGQAASLG